MVLPREILDSLPCGVVVTDASNCVILWNQTMAEITGINPHQAEGELIFRWFPELETLAVNARVPFHRNGQMLQVQKRFLTEGHSWTFQPGSVEPLDSAQIDFVSTVSHELRIPLTSIKGFVDTLLRSRAQLNEEQQVKFLNIIKQQADRLTRLAEDLLTMSRIQSGRVRSLPEGLQVREAVERILENLTQKALDHMLVWDIPDDLPPVWADRDRLEQIFTNLLDNAFKYSAPGAPVRIMACVDATDPLFLAISIVDRGIGIDRGALEHIFDRFYRAENAASQGNGSTGLGLYITRSLVESLGGRVAVESVVNQGSTFTVWLPIAPRLPQQAPDSHAQG
ncbi:PAS domain-containing protein [Anthocerotibacter panamensis]|uniref:PAS domain-containing protein n=1 Tax=Anthocerotibacter panamensis TaxID=2857077 RepID=UPI001FD93F4B|nr:PAS domain-containing protein [Anthocerotibacter panamensis]